MPMILTSTEARREDHRSCEILRPGPSITQALWGPERALSRTCVRFGNTFSLFTRTLYMDDILCQSWSFTLIPCLLVAVRVLRSPDMFLSACVPPALSYKYLPSPPGSTVAFACIHNSFLYQVQLLSLHTLQVSLLHQVRLLSLPSIKSASFTSNEKTFDRPPCQHLSPVKATSGCRSRVMTLRVDALSTSSPHRCNNPPKQPRILGELDFLNRFWGKAFRKTKTAWGNHFANMYCGCQRSASHQG